MLWPSITTLTFYEGEPPVEWLRGRVAEILEANPWLAGRLQGQLGAACVWVPMPEGVQAFAEGCFEEISAPGLRPDQPMSAMQRALEGQLVRKGVESLGQDEPLFRVLVVRTDPGRFALALSLSHVLGDGHTYYRLYAALGQEEPRSSSKLAWLPFSRGSGPRLALDPRRKPEFTAVVSNALGPSKLEWAGSLPAQLGNRVLSAFKTRQRWTAWEVDDAWVQAQKREHAGLAKAEQRGVPWVSTNDVLTSWFLRRRGYAYGFMSVNFRGKLCGLKDVHAGNYEGGIQYWPDEFGEPSGIRRSLSSPPMFRAGRDDAPGVWASLRAKFAVATNWASVQTVCQLPGCSQLLHLPVLSKVLIDGTMIIFRPTPDTLGVVLGEREYRPHRRLSREPALGRRIC